VHPSRFKSLKCQIQNQEDMGLELERGLELFFQKKMKKNITCPLPMFFALLLYFDT